MTLEVISICGGVGFPVGLATTQRIAYIATALNELGVSTTLLHCGPHPFSSSQLRSGEHRGTPYRYLGISTRRPESTVLRFLCYLTAYVELAYRLSRLRVGGTSAVRAVCLHVQGSFLNLYAGVLCTLLGFPIIIESCEWGPGIPGTPVFAKWIYRQVMFRFCSGAIAISKTIENCIKELSVFHKHPFPICMSTVLVDPSEFAHHPEERQSVQPTLVWCGDVTGYLGDVRFLTTVLAKLNFLGYQCVLEIVGLASNKAKSAIEAHARKEGVSLSQLHLTGYITRPELLRECGRATVLMQPLWNDVRSRARFPNKLGEYLMSGRPVVTCAIGEVAEYLRDSVNAIFYREGDSLGCANVICALLNNEDKARSVGLAGRALAVKRLSYRAQGPALLDLFRNVAR
jgi:hypothetical protein